MTRTLSAICSWCCCVALAAGQPAVPDATSEVGQSAATADASPNPDAVYIQDQEGRWVPVPVGSATPGARDDRNSPAAVEAYISSLRLEGSVVDDYADLTARLQIEIVRQDGWFEMPLALDQAQIYESVYTGEGEAAPAVPRNGESGIRWRFRGPGTHRLELKFRVPIKATPAGRQLLLSLPNLPPLFVAHALLRVPEPRVVHRDPPPDTRMEQRSLPEGGTEFECEIGGPRWELSWRSQTDDVPAVSVVRTAIRVGSDGEGLRLLARQQCEIEQGALAGIAVRMPDGFELQSVKNAGAPSDTLTTTPLENRPGWVYVNFGQTVQGTIELEWLLHRPLPSDGGVLEIAGLEVDGAREQRGRIEIESLEGYTAHWRADESRALDRLDLADRRVGEPLLEYQFDFHRQPFRLVYELARIEAQTEAQSEVFLFVGSDGSMGGAKTLRAELYVDLRLQVLSGQLREIVLDWPGRAEAGWVPGFARLDVAVESGNAAVDLVGATIEQDELRINPDQVRLILARPCTGQLHVLLRFFRDLPAGEDASFALNVPRPAATFGRGMVLSVAGDIDLEMTVSAANQELPRIPRNGALPERLPPAFTQAALRSYALSAEPPELTVAWMRNPRQIVAETSVTVERVSSSAVRVVQEIAYRVSYGYLQTLLLEVPEELRGAVPPALLRDGSGGSGLQLRLDGEPVTSEVRDGRLWISLPQPRHGSFRLTLEHVLRLTGKRGSLQEIVVPILRSADADFAVTELRTSGVEAVRLAEDESGWQAWVTRSGTGAWLTNEQRSAVQLVIDESLRNVPQQFTVQTAFVRTWLGDAGEVSVQAEYEIRDAPSRVLLTLPEGATALEFRWNRELLTADRLQTAGGSQSQYLLEPGGDAAQVQSGRLSVRYRLPQRQSLGLVSWRGMDFPAFGDKVLVNETFWEVMLPPGQQLFAPPEGMVPQYSWERQAIFWVRRLTPEYLERKAELAPADAASPVRGNIYAYGTIGAPRHGEFGAMAQSLIVLIGAGITLLLGFVFGRFPATRNVLSILVLAFLFALASLWQLELMQLLLQPAVFGLGLAAVATVFDSAARRGVRARARDTSLEPLAATPDRRSSVQEGGAFVPARTAVYQPEPVSDSGRAL